LTLEFKQQIMAKAEAVQAEIASQGSNSLGIKILTSNFFAVRILRGISC
jgi:hypothetical protein